MILKLGTKNKRKPIMKVNNIYSLMLAVDAGAGLALPDYMVGDNKGLVRILPDISGPKYEAHFVYPQSLKCS